MTQTGTIGETSIQNVPRSDQGGKSTSEKEPFSMQFYSLEQIRRWVGGIMSWLWNLSVPNVRDIHQPGLRLLVLT